MFNPSSASLSTTKVSTFEVSVVMPCLNAAATLGVCIYKVQSYFSQNHISGEIVIADNGSTDGSQEIARQ